MKHFFKLQAVVRAAMFRRNRACWPVSSAMVPPASLTPERPLMRSVLASLFDPVSDGHGKRSVVSAQGQMQWLNFHSTSGTRDAILRPNHCGADHLNNAGWRR